MNYLNFNQSNLCILIFTQNMLQNVMQNWTLCLFIWKVNWNWESRIYTSYVETSQDKCTICDMSKKLKCRARKFGVKTELADPKLVPQNWPKQNWPKPKTGPSQNWPDLTLAQSQNWSDPVLAWSPNWPDPNTGLIPKLVQFQIWFNPKSRFYENKTIYFQNADI